MPIEFGETVAYRNLEHAERCRASARKWRIANPERGRASWHKSQHKVKTEVLTRYSPGGKLGCSWDSCAVSDIDMLTLDHVANDGNTHLGVNGKRLAGLPLYRWVKKRGYPEGFQTMCANHQLKKAIMLAKERRK